MLDLSHPSMRGLAMTNKILVSMLSTVFLAVIMASSAFARDYVDRSRVYAEPISMDAPIHVRLFDTSRADLGKHSVRDTANAMVKSAPHLLAVDIVEALRRSGFTQVTLDETPGEPSGGALQLTGRFTELDPGSQNLRVWIGFGAGESKVCIEGELNDAAGTKLADFSDCRKGLGWGASAPQADDGAEILGDRVALFLTKWAEGSSK